VEVRPAGPGDLDGVRRIAAHYGNLDPWPERPDWLDYEFERGALWVADDARGVAGFAGVLVDGDIAHLADVFVRPDALGRGIGRRLLDAALPATGTRVTFASSDPRALPVYVRAGMQPLAPVIYLEGTLDGTATAERVDAPDLVGRDAAAAGRARPAALDFLARAGAHGLRGGERDYAVVRPAGGVADIGPAAGDADGLLALLAGAGPLRVALLGPHPALRPLLEAGLRISAVDTYMGSRPDVVDPQRYVPHSDVG
jgi:GNAT superfamily N-acetyltransferase